MAEISETFMIQNKLGLHARAAALLVKTVAQFSSDVLISARKQNVNGKSIMGVLMLAASQGTKVKITVNGKDAVDCMAAISKLIENKFGEE